DATVVQAHARRAVWTFHAILMLTLGLLVWRAAGLAWACAALAFLAIEPTIGAHLPVVMTDLPLGLTLGIGVVHAAIAVTPWQWRWMIALGVALGLAIGSKHSALPGVAGLGLVCLLAVFVQSSPNRGAWRPRLLQLVTAALIGYATIWAQYG